MTLISNCLTGIVASFDAIKDGGSIPRTSTITQDFIERSGVQQNSIVQIGGVHSDLYKDTDPLGGVVHSNLYRDINRRRTL